MNDQIEIDEKGITYVKSTGERVSVKWAEISDVKARDYMRRLELFDSLGKRVMKLEYQLGNFDQLRNVIYAKLEDSLRTFNPYKTFAKSTYVKIGILFTVGVFLFMIALSLKQGEVPFALVFVAFLSMALGQILFQVQRIIIAYDHVELGYPLWNRQLKYEKVSNISLVNIREESNINATVFIEILGEKPIKLAGFKNGSVSLFQALRTAWSNSGKGTRSNA